MSGMSKQALASLNELKGDVMRCVAMAKSPSGVIRCGEYATGPGAPSAAMRKRAGVGTVKRGKRGKAKKTVTRPYSYSTKSYRAGKTPWAKAAAKPKKRASSKKKASRKGGAKRKTPKRGKGGRFVKSR
ncbi:MAG: hypothetical protein ABII82_01910 [Verrucomicrobiota bacterium]